MPSFLRPLTLILVCGAFAAAADGATVESSQGGLKAIIGSLGGLILGIIQLVVGFTLAAFAITRGLALVGKLLGGIDIWEQIKQKNIAVALIAGGVALSYMTVIAGGIESMTKALAALSSGGWSDGLTGLFSGAINLVIAIMVASAAITVVFKIMDKLTKGIDEKKELAEGNVAVGVLYVGILLGVSGMVASGVQGIGSGINIFLSALLKTIGL